jgi:PIN domain nuclease of toxin-antitoxin system
VNYVLDAGPLIALLNGEAGADVVEDVLTEPGSTCYIHCYNLCEIYYQYFRRGGQATADEVVSDLLDLGICLRDDSDISFWKSAGSIKAQNAMSLPDAFCLSLGIRLGATVVTTDHGEFDPIVPLGLCPIRFIR